MMRAAVLLALWASACSTVDTDTDTDSDFAPPVLFGFPVLQPERIDQLIGVDHKPGEGEGLLGQADCLDYLGQKFPHCYDGHDGSDFALADGFEAMDAGSATVIAAADGTVQAVHDGEFDRCKADRSKDKGVDCGLDDDGEPRPIVANFIDLVHDGGVVTRYLHLKNGSKLVSVGQVVERGAPLALIGSSGRSSFPHLHFEVQDASGVVIDPFAGPYSQPESWWCDQQEPDVWPGPCAD